VALRTEVRAPCDWGESLSWSFGGLVAVYFGFPAVWVWPIWKVYGWAAPDWALALSLPVGWLGQALPWYKNWVDWGLALFGIR
jgi:hypothetical protein